MIFKTLESNCSKVDNLLKKDAKNSMAPKMYIMRKDDEERQYLLTQKITT
jgi:hypothetical protein